jgi:YidC/Oxa1 family membrane protein insertase
MVVTQVIQMKLTPMNLGPNASDQQRIQAKMMRMMPYIFLVFLYFFSSALVLYWTIQNVLSIVQTLMTKHGSDAVPIPVNTVEEPQEKTKVLDSVQHVSQEERTHRKALGLRLRGDLSKKEIKVAFKERIKRFHPDKIRNLGAKRQSQAEEKRKKLELAYEFLLNKG